MSGASSGMTEPICKEKGHVYWDDVWCPVCKYCDKTYSELLAEYYSKGRPSK